MEYRFLGPTGLKVSLISYGSWMFEHENSQQSTIETVKKALEYGINYFDNAEGYGSGKSETELGVAFKTLKIQRENIVVSTKIFRGPVGGENKLGVSRKRVIEGLTNSLKRL